MTTFDKIGASVFGVMTAVCLIAAQFNGWYLLFAAMCAIMVWAIISEARKGQNNPKQIEMETRANTQQPDILGVAEPSRAVAEPSRAYEIAEGMTTEEMTSMFFDKEALIEPPYRVWQLNSKGHRYYYRLDENGEPEFFPSVTTILSQTLPQSPFLIKWIADKGMDEAERYKNERAAYGTFMHATFEKLLIERKYNLDNLKGDLLDYMAVNRLPDDFVFYADDLKKDVLAFAQFVKDYGVRPLAVEIALVHPIHRYAGMIDCPCTMLAKKGGEERITAIVDFKSGRKGFYEGCEIQLHLYKMMWDVTFPDYPIERLYNFSPKDWRKKPTYNLKEQTNSMNAAKIPALLELAEIEDKKRDNVFTAVSGTIDLDSEDGFEVNVVSLTLSELVKAKAPKDETPTEDADGAETTETGEISHETAEPIKYPTDEQNAVKTQIEEK